MSPPITAVQGNRNVGENNKVYSLEYSYPEIFFDGSYFTPNSSTLGNDIYIDFISLPDRAEPEENRTRTLNY